MGAFPAQPSRKGQQPYALVAVTVFRDSGLALPGAEVSLAPDPKEKPSGRFKRQKAVADSRGELVFRVPAEPMRYQLRAEAKGYTGETRVVSIQGEERVDVFFRLSAASKP